MSQIRCEEVDGRHVEEEVVVEEKVLEEGRGVWEGLNASGERRRIETSSTMRARETDRQTDRQTDTHTTE